MIEASGRSVFVSELQFSVEEWAGERGPLIGLHGHLGAAHLFNGLGNLLAPAWRLLAFDQRGRGLTDAPDFGYGYQLHVADTIGTILALGLPRPVLVGHGAGATAALCLAAWYPELPAGLILLDGGAPVSAEAQNAIEQQVNLLDAVYPSEDAYLEAMRAQPCWQPWSDALAEQLRPQVTPTANGVRARARRELILQDVNISGSSMPDYPALWRRVQCPTLVVRAARGFFGGEEAVMLQAEDYQRMLTAIPNVRGVEVDAGHQAVLCGEPVASAESIRAFLPAISWPV